MFLFLTAIDRQGQNRDFTCQLSELEKAFELLSYIVAQGDILLHAHIVEHNGQRWPLPLEAFDGASFIIPIQGLKQQWLDRLTPLPASTPTNFAYQEIIQRTRNRISHYENQIDSIQQLINRFDDLQQRAQACASPNRKPSRAIVHFDAVRMRYEQQLSQAHQGHQVALELLARLTT